MRVIALFTRCCPTNETPVAILALTTVKNNTNTDTWMDVLAESSSGVSSSYQMEQQGHIEASRAKSLASKMQKRSSTFSAAVARPQVHTQISLSNCAFSGMLNGKRCAGATLMDVQSCPELKPVVTALHFYPGKRNSYATCFRAIG